MWFRVKNRQNRLGSSLREGLGWCLTRIATISHAFEDWSTSICRDHLKLKFLKDVQIATGCLDFVQLFASARFKDFKRTINSFTFFWKMLHTFEAKGCGFKGAVSWNVKKKQHMFFLRKKSNPPWKLNKNQPRARCSAGSKPSASESEGNDSGRDGDIMRSCWLIHLYSSGVASLPVNSVKWRFGLVSLT